MMILAKSIPLTRNASDLNTGNLAAARLPVSGTWSLSAGLTISGFPVTIASLIGSKIYPAADSTTAIQVNKADGNTNVLNVDTTNGRVGIGTTSPTQKLDIVGNIKTSGALYMSSTSALISSDTVDGADTKRVAMAGGGALTFNQGAYVVAYGNEHATSPGVLQLAAGATGSIYMTGNVGIGLTAPTAYVHIKAGTATANTAPLKLTKGVLNTTAEIGAIEFVDDNTTGAIYMTFNVAGVLTRKQFAFV